jgi:hypothetical protein
VKENRSSIKRVNRGEDQIIFDDLIKSQKTIFCEAGNSARSGTLPPLEVNSSGSIPPAAGPDDGLLSAHHLSRFPLSVLSVQIFF